MNHKNNIIVPTRNDTLIILDWDDTLFPTKWTAKNNINLNDPEVRNRYTTYFTDLDNVLYTFLKKLKEYGKVIIVTNAMPQWVKISASVLVKTSYLINTIKVVSARKNYSNITNNMMDWKKLAFKDEVAKELANNKILHVISIGDAEYEYRALINLYNATNKIKKIFKSIKLVNGPCNETLLDQLEVLSTAIRDVCLTNKHLDLKFKFFSPYRYD